MDCVSGARSWRGQKRGELGCRLHVPSWLISLVLHVAVLIVLGLMLPFGTRQGAVAERTAEVGIVLKRQEGGDEYFEGEKDSEVAQQAPAAANVPPNRSPEDLLSEQPPVDPTDALPDAMDVIGLSATETGGVGNAGRVGNGPRGSGIGMGNEGKTTATLFGLEGEGSKFVYVFDRSGSMGGSGRNALNAAKTELVASLRSLDRVHQFQIIFYNENPVVFNPSGRAGKLAFATEQNKERARRFIGSILSDGATRHEAALKQAIRMQPDVIFFLTDADEPRLSAGQLYEIRRRAGGITINAIEFGLGPKQGGDNFLMRLARQNGGQYAYVDVSQPFAAGGR